MDRHIWIGTSGYTYPHWREGVFYPAGLHVAEELAFYIRQFRTVELNYPFYRLPSRANFALWSGTAPAGFRFAVKVSRYITHLKHLRECEEPLRNFLAQAAGLEAGKRGPLLFQLPGAWKPNLERLREFLPLLPRDWQCAFEFRNPEWWQAETLVLLRQYGAAFCLPVSPQLPPPPERLTAGFAYLRLHGGQGAGGSFEEEELQHWAGVVRRLHRQAAEVYVYFNNDQQGCAVRNARRLVELLSVEQRARSGRRAA